MASLPAGFFYPSVWDPPLIMLQILAMQCLFYLAVGVGLVFYGLLLGQGFFLYEQVFSAGLLHFSSPLGWSTVLSFLSAALASAVALMWVVERAKKCLDFGSTVYILHAIFCICYDGGRLPRSWFWWVFLVCMAVLTSVLGEYLCWRREIRSIPFGPQTTNKSPPLLEV